MIRFTSGTRLRKKPILKILNQIPCMLKGKKIIIGITGSIAAYKIPLLIRLLKKEEAEIQVVMTPAATDFVTPLSLSVLSENPVLIDSFDPVNGQWNSHIQLGLWADIFLMAPLSANSMAKMANGIADNLLLTTFLSARCPVFFAPAMDLDMYNHFTTRKNIETLVSNGNHLIEAAEGELASGLCGEGRMEEPENIIRILKEHQKKKASLSGKKILITAGPTHEAIDPVRYIGNHSSGLMGFQLAREAANRGSEVYLISGPTNLKIHHQGVYRVDVITAGEMYQACTKIFEDVDITIMAAAVADFTPAETSGKKIKKGEGFSTINLTPTKDILLELGKRKSNRQLLIGFALETDNELENAQKKLENKNLDMIVLNSLNDEGAGFATGTNKISILRSNGNLINFELKSKEEVAIDIFDQIIKMLNTSPKK